jgi:hypothetical protein
MGFNPRQYLREFGSAMVVYSLSVPLTVMLVDRYQPEGAAAFAVAMIPVVPTLLALWAFLRQFWRMDELQRRVVSEAMVISAGFVGFITFAYGWLQAVMELPAPPLAYLWVLPSLIAVWGVALPFMGRRYS